MTDALLRGATLADGTVASVRVTGGVVSAVGDLTAEPGESVVDLAGWVLLPAFAEPHVHLDKAFTASGAPGAGGLTGAMAAYDRVLDTLRPADVRARALAALRRLLAAGATTVRCQVGCGPRSGVVAVETLAALRDDVRGTVDLQVVAHAAAPDGDAAAYRALLVRALTAGADLVGGNPFLEPRPDACLDACLSVAADAGCGVDLHMDETTDPATLTVLDLARRARAAAVPVVAAHCVSLGALAPDAAASAGAELAASGVDVVTLPLTNLYLQPLAGRGLTAVDALRAAGVRVAAGADNVQDPFNPVGRADPLEVASLLVTAAHQDVPTATAMVTTTAREIVGVPAGPTPGAPADLVAVPAPTLPAALADAPSTRRVWRRGTLVAETTTTTETAI